ncbi:hypothetical protein [uncultured Sphingomonas sp.]|uniref:hypothetical protein n=1 Tax=uncultured Sphingomonas sp. TaxID=158754 RepID=UPI0035CC01AE
MNWVSLAASLAAVLALAGVAWALRLGRDARIASPEEAADAAEAALAGFEARDVVLGADGAGALAVGADGRLAAVKRHGARAAVREVRWAAVRPTADGTVVETGERRFGAVTLTGVDALDLRRLAGELTLPFMDARRDRGRAG